MKRIATIIALTILLSDVVASAESRTIAEGSGSQSRAPVPSSQLSCDDLQVADESFFNIIFFSHGDANQIDTANLADPVREPFLAFLTRHNSFEGNFKEDRGADFFEAVEHNKAEELRWFLTSMSGDSGAAAAALAYSKEAPLSYEWEGMSDGPLSEAGDAARFIKSNPRSPILSGVRIFLLHRLRCAFECLVHEKKKSPALITAARYENVFQNIINSKDILAKAMACQMDKREMVYISSEIHPRELLDREERPEKDGAQ